LPEGPQQALDELGADVEDSLEELTLPAAIVDASGTLRWANAAAREVLGEQVGQSFFSLVDPADVRTVREDHARIVLGRGHVPDKTVTLVAPDGRRYRAELSNARLKNGDHVVGAFGVARLRPVAGNARPSTTLTPRQTQVLRLLASGRSTQQVAADLRISVETTRNHVRALLRRLHSRSRVEAVARAHALGLFDDDGGG